MMFSRLFGRPFRNIIVKTRVYKCFVFTIGFCSKLLNSFTVCLLLAPLVVIFLHPDKHVHPAVKGLNPYASRWYRPPQPFDRPGPGRTDSIQIRIGKASVAGALEEDKAGARWRSPGHFLRLPIDPPKGLYSNPIQLQALEGASWNTPTLTRRLEVIGGDLQRLRATLLNAARLAQDFQWWRVLADRSGYKYGDICRTGNLRLPLPHRRRGSN